MSEMYQVPGSKATLTSLSAKEVAQGIKNGSFSAREVLEAYIQRLEVINPQLNAVVTQRFEEARAEADAADLALAQGKLLGSLHGVPITIKDQFMLNGLPITWGIPSRVLNIAHEDGPLVKRLRQSGAIVLGKTNVPELLFYHESDNPLYGCTNNPWNLKRTPGGSSGGEASIIAAHGSPLGLGADIGGSIRIPAHFCGIHGLKPTSRRLTNLDSPSDLFPFGLEIVQAQPGPMARRVEDLALAMDVLAAPGLEKVDPVVAPVPWSAKIKDIPLKSLRVAMYTDDTFFRAAPALRRAVREAAAGLRARGVVVEEWTPPETSLAMQMYINALSANGGIFIKRVLGKNPIDFRIKGFLQITSLPNFLRPLLATIARWLGQHSYAFLLLNARPCSTDEYMELTAACNRYRTHFLQELNERNFDAIICPPYALPALMHGQSYFLSIAGSYSLLYNLLGMPAGVVAATCVQSGEESDRQPSLDIIQHIARNVETKSVGLPIGAQVVGRYWREDVVLAVMSALEEHFNVQKSFPLHSSN